MSTSSSAVPPAANGSSRRRSVMLRLALLSVIQHRIVRQVHPLVARIGPNLVRAEGEAIDISSREHFGMDGVPSTRGGGQQVIGVLTGRTRASGEHTTPPTTHGDGPRYNTTIAT